MAEIVSGWGCSGRGTLTWRESRYRFRNNPWRFV